MPVMQMRHMYRCGVWSPIAALIEGQKLIAGFPWVFRMLHGPPAVLVTEWKLYRREIERHKNKPIKGKIAATVPYRRFDELDQTPCFVEAQRTSESPKGTESEDSCGGKLLGYLRL
jgi:hypothetical protein